MPQNAFSETNGKRLELEDTLISSGLLKIMCDLIQLVTSSVPFKVLQYDRPLISQDLDVE